MSVRLLAVDVDGTLVRRDGTFDPRDLAAIRRARSEGVVVTLATGRLLTHALPVARVIECDAPMVCGDGATIACGRTGDVLARDPLPLAIVDAVLDAFAAHDVAPFVFSHRDIHSDARGEPHHPYVRGWTPEVKLHASLAAARDFRREGEVTMTMAIGEEAAASEAHRAVLAITEAAYFPAWGTLRAVRVLSPGCSKGAGVERLAARLGVARDDVAVVGDWWNDVSMFDRAKRSFVMAGAPEGVTERATDRLHARAGEGGGVAEAIARLLDG